MIDVVATGSRQGDDVVATGCSRCSAVGAAERQLLENAPPDYLDPAEHADLVIESLQEQRRWGHVLAEEIIRIYPELCAGANIAPISDRDLLRELGKRLKKSRRTVKLAGVHGGTRTSYFLPKPNSEKVISISKRAR